MNIKILGTGCPSCKTLETVTKKAVDELELNASINREEDIMKIMSYGVMRTPALVINEKLIFAGRVPSLPGMKEILSKYA